MYVPNRTQSEKISGERQRAGMTEDEGTEVTTPHNASQTHTHTRTPTHILTPDCRFYRVKGRNRPGSVSRGDQERDDI